MSSDLMRYTEYMAEIRYSTDSFHGRVIGMSDVIDFYGRTPEELRAEFKKAVDDYLAWCASEGRHPPNTWRDKLALRPTEEQRRRFIMAAAAHGLSVNAWALGVLDRHSRIVEDETPRVE